MNFRGNLVRKLMVALLVMVAAAMAIALAAVPAGAINRSPAQLYGGTESNSPPPVVIPPIINYQGYLTDTGGNPVSDTLEMTFSIYETESGGTAVWTETHSSVTVTDGLFNVILGSVNPINPGHLTGESYLGVTVGTDDEMVPRQRIKSVAYALRSAVANLGLNADKLDNLDSTEFAAAAHNHDSDYVNVTGDTMTGQLVLPVDGLMAGTDQFVLTGGKVGIGTTNPGIYKLNVQGGSTNGIYASGDNYGVYGAGSNTGLYGISANGWGVSGSGGTYGVFGFHSGTSNSGRIGTADEGVYGKHYSSGNYGQLGTVDFGVFGENSNGNEGRLGTPAYGVFGEYSGGANRGAIGSRDYGVFGRSTSGIGTYGINDTSGNYGQLGTSDYGVYGYANETPDSGGVHGESSNGNIGKLGTMSYGVSGLGSNCGVTGKHKDSNNFGTLGSVDCGVAGYGDLYGVYGMSDNDGVRGEGSTNGVFGYGPTGVYGIGYVSHGVYGESGQGQDGVYGYNTTSGNFGRLGSISSGVYGSGESYGVSGSGYYGVYGSGTFGVRGYGGTYGVLGSGIYGVYGSGSTWDFYASHNNYGPFTGAHEVKLADSFTTDIRPGLIVSVTGDTQVRTEGGAISYSSTLPTVQLSNEPNDKKIAGVLVSESPLPDDHWYQASDGERFGIINALGDGRVWVTDINGNIEAGDYITSSAIPGYGQKQDDDFLHNYTLGKATETVDWSQVTDTIKFDGRTYKAYPISVFYTSG